jgi:hypothetical protein
MSGLKIIGLVGLAGAGKSTVASYLEERWAFVEIAFADPIVDMAAALMARAGVGGEWMTERALKEQPMPVLGMSYRQLAQTLGTQWGRTLAPDLWVKIARQAVYYLQEHEEHVVISDVRFVNEAQLVRELGGTLVRVNRADLPALSNGLSQHASERDQAAIAVDHTLHNAGSIATLEQQVDSLVQRLHASTGQAA